MKGSVKKDKSSKSKNYYFVVDIPGADGKRRQKKKRGFSSKSEAEKALADFISEVNKGIYLEPSNNNYGEFIRTDWLMSKKRQLSKVTYDKYKLIVEKRIIPELGNIKINKIKPLHLERFMSNLYPLNAARQESKDEEVEPLALKSQIDIYNVIKQSFRDAVEWKLIKPDENPAKSLKRPKDERKKEITVLEEEELRLLLDEAKSSSYYLAFLLAATGGLRQSESLGLRWNNVSFKDNSVFITETLSHDGKRIGNKVKTKSSRRVVEMPQYVMDELMKKFEEIQNDKKKSGADYVDNNLVICTSLGKPINPRNLLRTLYNISHKADLKRISYHSLRHTHATLLMKKGISPKLVQERLGHSNVKILLQFYSHLLPSMQKETIDVLDNMLFKNKS
ncbi:site-specific integrase [Mesobacillus subterraneus]|uniref:site-specific integrase n=1 Tax=Mesobacillus subterraneus TaxID=285983 RepID=UPI001CFC9C1E|nr:site-specific integrase [Mesobacillus subterraneus]WLR55947.1 site-specific integrase [Mesobacillus subterraneus]